VSASGVQLGGRVAVGHLLLRFVRSGCLACSPRSRWSFSLAVCQVRGTVYISRQLILKQVMNDLKLKVHGSGFDSTLETLNMETAWLHVDLPCGNKGGADSGTVIFGNPKPSRNEAAESACQAVLDYYCSARDVKIDDFSSTVLKKKQEELDASKFFCAAMQDKVVRLVLERNAAVDAVQKLAQNIDVKLQPLSETIIKQKQDQLNNDCYYEILQDKITINYSS